MCFQIEMKIKVLEAKHQEEKLKMQQRHDADVEKVRRKKLAPVTVMDDYFTFILKILDTVCRVVMSS